MENIYDVNPGFHSNLKLSHFTDEEKSIIQRLSEEWYVTNGGFKINLGKTSEYRFTLIKPTNNYQEMFNLDKEIIVVFSPYEIFEPRTLDAVDVVMREYQKLRIEKICSVIISRDALIEPKIFDLLKQDQESQIIIPFGYQELLTNKDSFFIRNKFKKHFFSRDLFSFESPLRKDLYFFGRNDLVHKIVNRNRSNENSGLFGLRKTGKTSVIYGVERALDKLGELSVLIDCQNPGFHLRRWNKALHYIIRQIIIQNDLTKFEKSFKTEDKYTEINAPILFEKEIIKIWKLLEEKNILIIFDEIENITFNISPSNHWSDGIDFILFWQTIRSVFQKYNGLYSYLIVGTNSLCIEQTTILGKDNPLYNSMPYEYIERFDVPQTREMTRKLGRYMGLKFDETIYSKLTEDFGGHPFLMRHVCSVVNKISPEDRPVTVDRNLYEKAKEKFNMEYHNYIEMILNVLQQFYNEEYKLLELLAIGEVEEFKKKVESYPSLINHLKGYGIIDSHNNEFDFKIDSVKDFLCMKNKYKKLNLSTAEMISEISERRNKLEPKLRMIARNQLKAVHGKDEAKKKVMNNLSGPKQASYATHSYEELFNPTVCKIYFDDLRKIIISEWNCFKNIFQIDKDEFNTKMKVINKYRADAHAKDLNNDEMSYFRLSISSIEGFVDQYLS